jgi:16S rRNA (cytosine1402-N4)-methyltransferase
MILKNIKKQKYTILLKFFINSFNLIPTGGIIAVVSFHSIEDRIVKFFFKHYSEQRNSSRYLPETEIPEKCFKLINKKPILPGLSEIKKNPPSRSAKLRYGIKTNDKCDFSEFREKFKNLINIENLR